MYSFIALLQQETQDESPKQMTLGGLQPGSSYNICVHAMNEYGNSTSVTLTIATLGKCLSVHLPICLLVSSVSLCVVLCVCVCCLYHCMCCCFSRFFFSFSFLFSVLLFLFFVDLITWKCFG